MKTWKKSELNETYVYKQGGMRLGIRQSRRVSMRPHSCLLRPSVRLRASPPFNSPLESDKVSIKPFL